MLRLLVGERISRPIGGMVVVPGVRVKEGVLMKPVSRAVKEVGAALAHQIDLASGSPAKGGIVVRDPDSELIQTFDADGNDRHLISAACDDVIGYVDSIQVKRVLVASRASHGSAGIAKPPAIRCLIWR